jgi:hypothetical protein
MGGLSKTASIYGRRELFFRFGTLRVIRGCCRNSSAANDEKRAYLVPALALASAAGAKGSETRMYPWLKLSSDMILASGEAQRVFALRLMKLSRGGPSAVREANQMVSEKLAASTEAAMTFAGGGSPQKVLRRYRTIMRANEKRLRGGKS